MDISSLERGLTTNPNPTKKGEWMGNCFLYHSPKRHYFWLFCINDFIIHKNIMVVPKKNVRKLGQLSCTCKTPRISSYKYSGVFRASHIPALEIIYEHVYMWVSLYGSSKWKGTVLNPVSPVKCSYATATITLVRVCSSTCMCIRVDPLMGNCENYSF